MFDPIDYQVYLLASSRDAGSLCHTYGASVSIGERHEFLSWPRCRVFVSEWVALALPSSGWPSCVTVPKSIGHN
jgi:hypothetical protein